MISWRRFNVLVRCLSPNSSTVTRLNSGQYIGGKEKASVVVGAKAVDHWLEMNFQKPKDRKQDLV